MTFAEWRNERVETAKTEGKRFRNCSGRAIDLDVMALNHVLDYATKMKWLDKAPELHWDKMASAPAEDELPHGRTSGRGG
jgi:hypothetical protein